MESVEQVVTELNAMLDQGVSVELSREDPGAFVLRVVLDGPECEDCLVPDETLAMIATDSLERRGVPVSTVKVEHPPV